MLLVEALAKLHILTFLFIKKPESEFNRFELCRSIMQFCMEPNGFKFQEFKAVKKNFASFTAYIYQIFCNSSSKTPKIPTMFSGNH